VDRKAMFVTTQRMVCLVCRFYFVEIGWQSDASGRGSIDFDVISIGCNLALNNFIKILRKTIIPFIVYCA
jgi:hypothetical protein